MIPTLWPAPALLAALTDLGQLVVGATSVEESLGALGGRLASLVAHDSLHIWQWQGDRLTSVLQRGTSAEPPALADVASIAERAVCTSQTVIGAEAHGTDRPAASGPPEGLATIMAAPLLTPSAIAGALTVVRSGAPFSAEERATVEAFAGLAGAILTQGRLAREARARAEALVRLQEISLALNADLDPRRVVERIVAAATGLTGALFSTVLLVDTAGVPQHYVTDDPEATGPLHQPTSFRPGGTTATVLSSGRPLVIADTRSDPRASPLVQARGLGAVIGLPLLVEGQAIGLLWVNFAQPRRPTAEELGVLETLAAQAATAIRNARLYDEARRLADRDPLTGLINYRTLQDRLRQEIALARRAGEAVSILMIDLNGFKLVNDTHGHLVGDDVLRWVAEALARVCRESDSVGRYGGDEFLMVLPRTDADGARAVAQRVAEEAGRVCAAVVIPGRRLGVAIGMATWPDDGPEIETLVAAADRRLYAAKPSIRRRRPRPPARPWTGRRGHGLPPGLRR